MRRACWVLVLALVACWTSVTLAASQQAPGGYQLLTDPQGTGAHLVATRQGSGTATSLLVLALKEVAGFFDGRPQAVGGYRDAGDQRAEVVFRATLRGTPVAGIAYALVGGGTGTTGFVFDSPQTIRQSLPRLVQFAGGGVGPAPALNWRQVPFPDGSGSMRLPEGWVITFSQKGMATAKGPHGWIERGLWTPMKTRAAAAQAIALSQRTIGRPMPWPGPVADPTDPPLSVLQVLNAHLNTPDNIVRIIGEAPVPPIAGYLQATFFDYEVEKGGNHYRMLRFLMLSDVMADGGWIAYYTYVGAPIDIFPQNLPVLLEIWASAETAQHVLVERLQAATQSLKEIGEMVRQSTQTRARSEQRIHDKWTEVIRGTRIVEDTLTGERRDVDLGYSKDIVRRLNEAEGPDRYREIPLWQLNQ